MATDIIARGMITEYIAGTNINFTENRDGTVEISASGSISSEDSVARDAIGNHKSDTSNPHNVTPAQIGLGNVDNTSDLDKPISTAVQKAIDNKADKTTATTDTDGLMSAEDKGKLDAFEITTTGGKLHDKNIVTDDMSLPANGGNADTVDGLHADDFVNANDRGQIQIPNNVDVPVWIHANGKRFQRYTTNSGNIGLTNVPDNSTDYVWYWYDGMNIIARVYAVSKYFICDMINGVFSGWKDIYTSGNKPYVTGAVVVDSNGKANVSFGFDPSFVLYEPTSPKSGIFGSVYSATTFDATGFTPSADTYTGGLTGKGFSYIAFK